MRNHQANVLISGSGIGQHCEKYLSKPCFSYVHLTSSMNSSGLLPVPQALAACLKCYKTHGGCNPGWLFMGVLKSWLPHPLLFLMVHVLGTLLLHVPCLPGVHQLHGPAVWSLQELAQALGSLPKPTPLPPDCFCFIFAYLAHKGSGLLVHCTARAGSLSLKLNDLKSPFQPKRFYDYRIIWYRDRIGLKSSLNRISSSALNLICLQCWNGKAACPEQ